MTYSRITSPENPRLKQLRKLSRARERARTGLFVAEGEDLVLAAHAAGREAVYGFRAAGGETQLKTPGGRPEARSGDLGALGFEEIAPELLAGVSALGSGTRAIGVYEQRAGEAIGPLCVYLHGVKDPGNVGTVLRSALAFGAASVALGPGCADPYSAKAVRASMGAIFAVPVARVERVEQLPGERVALVAHVGEALAAGPPGEAVTLLIGAERDGLPDDVIAACERVAHIPIAGDSLNAAMAATVALYETTTHTSNRPIEGETRFTGLRSAASPSRVPKS